jgi:hypothetical protein
VRSTTTVEIASAARFRAQNGTTSRATLLRPVRCHTQRRLSTYDTTMPQPTATMLASEARTPAPTASATRIVALNTVVVTETPKQRTTRMTVALRRRARTSSTTLTGPVSGSIVNGGHEVIKILRRISIGARLSIRRACRRRRDGRRSQPAGR